MKFLRLIGKHLKDDGKPEACCNPSRRLSPSRATPPEQVLKAIAPRHTRDSTSVRPLLSDGHPFGDLCESILGRLRHSSGISKTRFSEFRRGLFQDGLHPLPLCTTG